jgi:hypothetical protein
MPILDTADELFWRGPQSGGTGTDLLAGLRVICMFVARGLEMDALPNLGRVSEACAFGATGVGR